MMIGSTESSSNCPTRARCSRGCGGIALILGFYSLQTLSANYAGFLLIALALILFILEIKVASHGALTIGGIVSLVLGSLMLFRSSVDPYLRISWGVILTMVGISAAFFGTVVTLAVRSQLRKPVTGPKESSGRPGRPWGLHGEGEGLRRGGALGRGVSDSLRKGDAVTVVDEGE